MRLSAQVFEEGLVRQMARSGANHIYNLNMDSAILYIMKIDKEVPGHPVVPLMKAMTLLWANIPTISQETFAMIEGQLDSVIRLSNEKDPELDDPEIMFFAMSAYGLLAEHYADRGYAIKAVGEAKRAYRLLRHGFDLTDDYPEYLLSIGLYNYFREKYPEKHPIYKPLLWFFKNGNKELGIMQLERAATEAILTKAEANVYLSYIYLRYEHQPKKAQEYLQKLCDTYPNNYYVKAKYLESIANPKDFQNAPLSMINSLINHENLYYKLAGYIFLGYYEEKVVFNRLDAEKAYRIGLSFSDQLPDHGDFFKGFGYLGLGRLLIQKQELNEAEVVLNMALKYAETEMIESEAKGLLSKI